MEGGRTEPTGEGGERVILGVDGRGECVAHVDVGACGRVEGKRGEGEGEGEREGEGEAGLGDGGEDSGKGVRVGGGIEGIGEGKERRREGGEGRCRLGSG